MTQEGLEIVSNDRIPLTDSLRPLWNQLQVITSLEASRGLSKELDEFKDKYWDILREEFSSGVGTDHDFMCIVARKPL